MTRQSAPKGAPATAGQDDQYQPTDRVRHDPAHDRIIDAVCVADKSEVGRNGGRPFLRAMVDHEFCTPSVCLFAPPGSLVEVIPVGDGVRVRHLVPAVPR